MGPRLVEELADRSPEEDAGRTRSVAPPLLSAWVSLVRSGEVERTNAEGCRAKRLVIRERPGCT
jgi:hypothetical protein